MKKTLVFFFLLLTCGLTELPACTDSGLELLPPPAPPIPDNKVKLIGTTCTQSPEDLDFPLRVLFLVDCSESMETTDPPDPITQETGKEKAVRETVERLFAAGGDVKVSIIRFSSEAQAITAEYQDDGGEQLDSYFTDDLDYILSELPRIGETDRTTNYIRALSEAYVEIRDELMNADQESLALSTYQVIMITDGLPDVEGDETRENSSENIIESVEGIIDLGRLFHVGKISVNTALLSAGNPAVDKPAEQLLKSMAEIGEGVYRSFASGGELNFLFVDLAAIKRIFSLKTLVVQNINASVIGDTVVPDSDGDGLADWIELAIGSDPYIPDSDGDGCRDGMEFRYRSSGMDPIDPSDCQCYVPDYCFDENENNVCDCPDGEAEGSCCVDQDLDGLCDCIDLDGDGKCDPANFNDGDGDGLFDCEERYSGTNRRGADSDGDGLVDFMELIFGTSPDINDVDDDFDWDAVPNGEEVKSGTDPRAPSQTGRSKLAYRYTIEENSQNNKGSVCYDFEVSNISLVEVIGGDDSQKNQGPAGQGFSGRNRILIFAGEVPFDDLESYARFRVACVEAVFIEEGNYKLPSSAQHDHIKDEDFHELTEFDPASDCIPAQGRNK